MNVRVLADADTVAREAAAVIAADARRAVDARNRFVMAVSGGQTPWLMLRALVDENLPWEAVHILQVDERVAPAGHADRNFTHLQTSLLMLDRLPPVQPASHAGRDTGLVGRRGRICAGPHRSGWISTSARSGALGTGARWPHRFAGA